MNYLYTRSDYTTNDFTLSRSLLSDSKVLRPIGCLKIKNKYTYGTFILDCSNLETIKFWEFTPFIAQKLIDWRLSQIARHSNIGMKWHLMPELPNCIIPGHEHTISQERDNHLKMLMSIWEKVSQLAGYRNYKLHENVDTSCMYEDDKLITAETLEHRRSGIGSFPIRPRCISITNEEKEKIIADALARGEIPLETPKAKSQPEYIDPDTSLKQKRDAIFRDIFG